MQERCCRLHFTSLYPRLKEELGSGEFGVVRRGVWSVGGEEREVAVKSLADGSTEEKRIQFLQEAAIMGQFKHPNVITLHGVRIEKEPVISLVCIIFIAHKYTITPSARLVNTSGNHSV